MTSARPSLQGSQQKQLLSISSAYKNFPPVLKSVLSKDCLFTVHFYELTFAQNLSSKL